MHCLLNISLAAQHKKSFSRLWNNISSRFTQKRDDASLKINTLLKSEGNTESFTSVLCAALGKLVLYK